MTAPRTIPFGRGRHLGTLYARTPTDVWRGGDEWWDLSSQRPVTGPVTVPGAVQVRLWGSQKAANGRDRLGSRFDGLRDLAPDDLDSLAVLDPEPGWAAGIAHLTRLSELICDWSELADEEFDRLTSLHRLVSLDVGNGPINAAQLGGLIDANPGLRFLKASGRAVADAVAAIARRRQMAQLKMARTGLTDHGLVQLSGLTRLTHLDLAECPVTDTGIDALADMADLQELDLKKTSISDAGAAGVLGRLTRLRVLRLGHTGIGDASVAALNAPHLTALSIADTGVTGETLDAARLPRLEEVFLPDCAITGAGMARIASLPNLRRLYLYDAPIDDEGLAHLNGHPTLEHVSLLGSPVSPGALLRLIDSLPNLERLDRGFGWYRSKEDIAELAAELRTAPAHATTISPEDLEPDPGTSPALDGGWTDLGDIVDDPTLRLPRAFAYDRFDRLWVAYGDRTGNYVREGLDPATWQEPGWWPDGSGPIPMDRVFGAFAFDRDGRLWMGDHDLWSYHRLDRVKLRRELPGETGHYVDITFDGRGRPWVIRTYGTIKRSTRKGWEAMQPPTLEPNTAMYAIEAHPGGSIWIGTGAGLLRWRRGEWTHWPGPADGLPASYEIDAWAPSSTTGITSLAVARDGSVWAAGGTGVVRFDGGGFTRWDHRDGIWPWQRLTVDPATGDVYGVRRRHIGRFDGSRWHVSGVPYEGGGRNPVHVAVRDGALLVLVEKGRFLRFLPADLQQRRAAAVRPSWFRRAAVGARNGR
jgi:hypothetical protein